MLSVIKLIRPSNWVKNIFIFLPVFFSGNLNNIKILSSCLISFLIFSLTASSVYVFNDIFDKEADKLHPQKCNRPIASGKISIVQAYLIIFFLFLVIFSSFLLFISREIRDSMFLIIIFYILMNLFYSIYLKHLAIVDIFIISIGFIIRIIIGSISSGIQLTHWIIIMTFLLALFLALAKRRDDVMIFNSSGIKARKNINSYNISFLNQSMTIVATITIVSYIMYSVQEEVIERFHSSNVYITSVFVLLGVLRYMQISLVDLNSGNPTKILFKDRFIQISIILWILTFYYIIYF